MRGLAEILERRRSGWLAQAARAPLDQAFASAARSLGRERLELDDDERASLIAAGVEAALETWCVDELGRACLLLGAGVEHVEPAFYHGDNRERRAVLKLLPLLPEPLRFVPLAAEACRTNVKDVFDALAVANPFPALYFPELPFAQMVLKALFIGTPLAGVRGLTGRVSPELLRMADDYASERRAAGRSVPADIALLHELAGSDR